MTGKIEISGKLVSLLDKSMNVINAGNYCFHSLFISETSIITAENLIFPASTSGYTSTYVAMFSGCSSMVLPPNEFAPLALGTYACQNMFLNCTSLIKATKIKATYFGTGSIRTMFQGCTSMIDGGDEILTANGGECCLGTFMGCTKLEKAPYFKATTLGSSCYGNLFRGTVNYVTLYHFASLNTSSLVFTGSTHANTFIIDAVTPPTIGSSTITGLKSGCIICVPDESVQAYKEAQYWSARANYIKGMSDIWQAYIQDGLVLHLDAKKVGETEGKWTDLISGRELTASNVVFNSDHVLFNGTNSNVYFNPTVEPTYTSPLANNACTIECVFEDTSDGTSDRCIYMPNSTGRGAIYLSGDKILTGTTGDSMGDYARVAKGSISISKSSGFWNGEALTKLSTNTTVRSYYARAVYIGRAFNSAVFQGKLSSIRIYNRVLTRAEVYNNYQIDKIRFPSLFV